MELRYLEAELWQQADEPPGETVFVPLTDEDDDAPATLVDPVPEYRGAWARESDRHARPARYLRVA